MNQAHDILRRLFEAMEPPRSAVATRVWDEAREFLRRPKSLIDRMEAGEAWPGTRTGRFSRSEPEMQNLPGTPAAKIARLAQSYGFGTSAFREIGKSPLLAMPYQRRMNATDLAAPGDREFAALERLEQNDRARRIDHYLEMARMLTLPPIIMGIDLARELKDLSGITEAEEKGD